MRISNISAVSFSKKPLMTCLMTKKDTKQKVGAILYEFDVDNQKDVQEVLKSRYTADIAPYFDNPIKNKSYDSNFYVLRDEKNREIISAAKTTRHFVDFENPGTVTVIDEFCQNPNYVNGAEPTIAQIAKNAINSDDRAIISALRQEDVPYLNYRVMKFTPSENGDWTMKNRRYLEVLDNAKARERVVFLDETV